VVLAIEVWQTTSGLTVPSANRFEISSLLEKILLKQVRAIPEKSVSWGQNAIDIKLSWWRVKLHLKFAGLQKCR
jgi:hypothetical protein